MDSVVGRGTLLAGRYRTLQPLASDLPGASLWEAADQILDRPVRVTVLHAGLVPQALDAARRAALASDPRLVRVLDVGEHEDVSYTVTEQVSGPSLAELVARGPLPADQARAIVGEAAAALEAARRLGVHHLTLRPSVLHLTPDDRVLLSGLAVDAALLGRELRDADAATRADTVGLVGLLYAALTGRWPRSVPGTDDGPLPHLAAAPVLEGAPVPPAELASGVPNDLDTLCAVTLGVHDDGPRTPAELVRELEPWGDIRATDLFGTSSQPATPAPTAPIATVRRPEAPSAPVRVQRTSVRRVLAGGSSAVASRPGTPPPAVPSRASSITGPAVRTTALPTTPAPRPAPDRSPEPDDAPTTALPAVDRGAPSAPPATEPPAKDGPGAAPAPAAPADTSADPATSATPAPPVDAEPAPTTAPRGVARPSGHRPTPARRPTSPAARATPTRATVAPAAPIAASDPDAPDAPTAPDAPDAPTAPGAPTAPTDPDVPTPPSADAPDDAAPAGDLADAPTAAVPSVGAPPPPADAPARSSAPATSSAVPLPAAAAALPARPADDPDAAGTEVPGAGAPGTEIPDRQDPDTARPRTGNASAGLATPPPAPDRATTAPSTAAGPSDRPPLLGLGSRVGGPHVAAARESIAAHQFDPTRFVLLVVGLVIVLGLFTAYRALTRPVDFAAPPPEPVPVASEPAPEPAPQETAVEEPAPEPATGPPVIASAAQLDPPPAGDDNEHPEAVPLGVDGDPSTVWFTRTYSSSTFGGLKTGVGYAVTLAEPATVSAVTLQVQGSGGRVEVRATDPATPTEGEVLAQGALGPETVLTLSEPTEAEHVVLWFTELPQTADGSHRIELAEVSVS